MIRFYNKGINQVFYLEEKKYIYEIYKGKSTFEITDMLNKKFDKNYTRKQIVDFLGCHNLKTNCHMPWCNSNTKQERSYLKNGKLVYRVKNENNKWESKAKYLYRTNIGKIPDGYCVMLLDGSCDNFNLDNLYLVSKRIRGLMNVKKLCFTDKEMNKTSAMAIDLMVKCYDLSK